MELSEIISTLLQHADPEGSAYGRLMRMRNMVADKVMLSRGDMKLLQSLVDMTSNIECKNVGEVGECRLDIPGRTAGKCEFISSFRRCPLYERQKHDPREKPLSMIGGK